MKQQQRPAENINDSGEPKTATSAGQQRKDIGRKKHRQQPHRISRQMTLQRPLSNKG